jgi:hypothetical protein
MYYINLRLNIYLKKKGYADEVWKYPKKAMHLQ